VARNEYITLLQQTEPEATDAQLQAALVKRAVEGVIRVLSMRDDKQPLTSLVKQGTLGEDVWTQFTVSEKELESEIMAIIEEANTFKKGWGSTILQTASEMVCHSLWLKFILTAEEREREIESNQRVRRFNVEDESVIDFFLSRLT